jgi:hypothetical protein
MSSWLRHFKLPVALLLQPQGLVDTQTGHTHTSFQAWCAASRGAACQLHLSLQLTFDLCCDPQLPLPNDAAALAWARRVLVHYHGEVAQRWALAAWAGAGCRGVSALHGVDLALLKSTALAHTVQLRRVQPWWPQALAQALAAHDKLRRAAHSRVCVVEGAWVAVLHLQRGRLRALHQHRLASATVAALQALMVAESSHDASSPALPCVAVGWGLADGKAAAVSMLHTLSHTLSHSGPQRQHLRSGWAAGLV